MPRHSKQVPGVGSAHDVPEDERWVLNGLHEQWVWVGTAGGATHTQWYGR